MLCAYTSQPQQGVNHYLSFGGQDGDNSSSFTDCMAQLTTSQADGCAVVLTRYTGM